MPYEKRGETPIAYVVPNDSNVFEVSGLKEHLSNNLANFKLPRKIVVMDSLPKNATGKIMKKTLRELNQ